MAASTDQGWALKDEPCRANNWKTEEVVALLGAIKSNNLMKGAPSSNQLGRLVEPLLGYSRTAFQITSKLKNLRKSYLTCEKKGCTPLALKDCPYYTLLSEVYANERDDDSDANVSSTASDVKVSSQGGMEKMLTVIKDLNLAPELPRGAFSPSAVRLISKVLIARGIFASAEQVKSALADLRKAYVDLKENGESEKNCWKKPQLEHLHALWGSVSFANALNDTDAILAKPKARPHVVRDKGDYWSEEETFVLLSSIIDFTDEASKNTEAVARKLKDALKDSGYTRSKYQIRRRLDNLHNSYLNAQRAKSLGEAIRKFPLYPLYESIFNSSDLCIPDFCTSDAIDELNARERHEVYEDEDSIPWTEKTKHSRSRSWSDEETVLMLTLLNDLNLAGLIAHRLSFEIACKLVEPMRDHGHNRSAIQIQVKLRNLRKSYYRCIRAGSTEKAIADCPFYDKLNAIFRQPKDRKLRTVQKLEPIDSSLASVSEPFTNCNYSNAAGGTDKLRTVPKVENDDSDQEDGEVWLPVETICDESIDDSVNVHKEEEVSDLEQVDEGEIRVSNDDEDAQSAMEDPPEEATAGPDNDTEPKNAAENITRKDCLANGSCSKDTNCCSESPGPSNKSAEQLEPPLRRSKRNATKPLCSTTSEDLPALKSMRIVMAEVLRHEKLLQRQHHLWMERQFEIQRKHDREQRELLIEELKEFRKAVTSAKVHLPESPT